MLPQTPLPTPNEPPPPLGSRMWALWRNYIWPLALSLVVLTAIFLVLPLVQTTVLDQIGRALIILIGGILPAILYRYFAQGRLPTFFKEYKQNLRRLGFPENARQYKDKFDATYGDAGMGNEITPFNSPVFMATILSFIGWSLVFFPLDPARPFLTPNTTPLAYGFLGAYTVGLSSLVRQYVTDDLQLRYYASLTNRYLIVFVLSWFVSFILPDQTADNGLLVAFFIGLFPTVGLRVIERAATALLGIVSEGFRETQPLSLLDGLNAYHEDRLLLEGIENLQNLASANIVDLMLKTRFPVDQIVDWMDQALLQIHTRERFEDFRRSGMRTATDFLTTYRAENLASDERKEWLQQLGRLIDSHGAAASADGRQPGGDGSTTPTLIETIAYALQHDPNLFHIRYWRTHEFEALPEDIDYERTQADLKLIQNLPDEAIAVYDKLLRDFPNYYATLLYRGLAYSVKGDYPAAIDDYTAAIEQSQNNPEWEGVRHAFLFRGRALLALGDAEGAAANYEEAVKAYPDDFPEAMMELAVVQMSYLGKYDKAIENLDEVIKVKFNEAEALANRGVARYERLRQSRPPADTPDGLVTSEASRKRELQLARLDLERALRLKPTLIPFHINLAHILGEQNELELKERTLTAALAQLEVTPNADYAYRVRLERGYLYLQTRRYQEAVTDFQAATRLAPEPATAYYFLGSALQQLEQWRDSAAAYERATALDLTLAPAYEGLGAVLLAQGNNEAAETAYVSALRLVRQGEGQENGSPGEASIHLGLGRLYRQMERWEDAEREINSARNLAQDKEEEIFTHATYELGLILLGMGRISEAVMPLSTSAVLYDVSGDERASARAYLDLGRAHAQAGNKTEACRALETAQERLNTVYIPGSSQDEELRARLAQELARLA